MDGCFKNEDSSKVSNRKQAIIAATFIMFVIYNVAVLIAYIKKDSEVSGIREKTQSDNKILYHNCTSNLNLHWNLLIRN